MSLQIELGVMNAMSNIIQFPAKSVRDWTIIERALLEELSKNKFPSEVQQRLVDVMRSFYEALNLDFNFVMTAEFPPSLSSAQVSDLCSSISERVAQTSGELLQSFTNKLFFERLNREIAVCHELGLI